MLTPNLLFLQVFAILLATQERPSAFEADPGGELAKLLVPVGEHGMNETDTDGVYFTEGRCCGSWVGSLQVHQLVEADSANLAEWEAVYRALWGSRGWFLTEETAPAADADSSNQDGDGGGLPSGDGAGPGLRGGYGHSLPWELLIPGAVHSSKSDTCIAYRGCRHTPDNLIVASRPHRRRVYHATHQTFQAARG